MHVINNSFDVSSYDNFGIFETFSLMCIWWLGNRSFLMQQFSTQAGEFFLAVKSFKKKFWYFCKALYLFLVFTGKLTFPNSIPSHGMESMKPTSKVTMQSNLCPQKYLQKELSKGTPVLLENYPPSDPSSFKRLRSILGRKTYTRWGQINTTKIMLHIALNQAV